MTYGLKTPIGFPLGPKRQRKATMTSATASTNTPAASTTRDLKIDNMHGDSCVNKVTTALKGVAGVTTRSVKVGSATISADDTATKAACTAVTNAGYKCIESAQKPTQNGNQQPSGQSRPDDKNNTSNPQSKANGMNNNDSKDKGSDTLGQGPDVGAKPMTEAKPVAPTKI